MAFIKRAIFGESEETLSGSELVERLCERIQSSRLRDDRREALKNLKLVSKKFKLEVGARCMKTLSSILNNEHDDFDMVSTAMEILVTLMTFSFSNPNEASNGTQEISLQFTEMFLQDPVNLANVLHLLEENDFKVRWSALSLFSTLVSNMPKQVNSLILKNPMGVPAIIDLFNDAREVIRNEALLVVCTLTRYDSNLQKLIVFESGFERIFTVIFNEGGIDGGVVVEDCLNIILNLLHGNTCNQTFFIEAKFIQKLKVLFEQFVEKDLVWNFQQVKDCQLFLKVVKTLVSSNNLTENASTSQNIVYKCGLLDKLCELVSRNDVPTEVKSELVQTVGECVRGTEELQCHVFSMQLHGTSLISLFSTYCILSIVAIDQAFTWKYSHLYCFTCLLYKNEQLKRKVAEKFRTDCADHSKKDELHIAETVSSDNYNVAQLLITGLSSSDAFTSWCSAIALFYIVFESSANKELFNEVVVESFSDKKKKSLMEFGVENCLKSESNQVQIGILILISAWIAGHQPSVLSFMGIHNSVHYLTALMTKPSIADDEDYTDKEDSIVKSLCAFVIGLCLLYIPNSEPSWKNLIDVVEKRIGLQAFLNHIYALSKTRAYLQASKRPILSLKLSSSILLDNTFIKFHRSFESSIVYYVCDTMHFNLEKFDIAEDPFVLSLKTLIRNQAQSIEYLTKEIENCTAANHSLRATINHYESQLNRLSHENDHTRSSFTANSSEVASNDNEVVALRNANARQHMIIQRQEMEIQKLKEILSTHSRTGYAVDSQNHNQEAVALNQTLQSLKHENEHLKSEISELKSMLRATETDHGSVNNMLEVKISDLKEKVADLEKNKLNMNNTLALIKAEKDKLEKDILKVKQNLMNSEYGEQMQNKEMKELKAKLAATEESLQDTLHLLSVYCKERSYMKSRLRELGDYVEDSDGTS